MRREGVVPLAPGGQLPAPLSMPVPVEEGVVVVVACTRYEPQTEIATNRHPPPGGSENTESARGRASDCGSAVNGLRAGRLPGQRFSQLRRSARLQVQKRH